MVDKILTSIEDDEQREKLVQGKDADGNCPALLAEKYVLSKFP